MNAFERLIRRLQMEQADADVFIGGSGVGGVTEEKRLYGGLVLSQAAVAAARTVPEMLMHSMHAYFLRPGRPDLDIEFAVERIKEGRNFKARSVTALQGRDIIFQMIASFARNLPDVEHQDTMKAAQPPESLPNRDQLRGRSNWQSMPIDVRLCDGLTGRQPLEAAKSTWMRPTGAVPDDPIVHLGLLVYATDRALLSTAFRPHAEHGKLKGASLDHSIWFHDEVRFDDWVFYQMVSPVARFQRGLVQAGIYTADGRRIASVAQEGLLSHVPHAEP